MEITWLVVYAILAVATGWVLARNGYPHGISVLAGVVFPVTWAMCAMLAILESDETHLPPTFMDGGEVPLVPGQTDDRQAKTPVNTAVNTPVNRLEKWEYMTLFTEWDDTQNLQSLRRQGWKAVHASDTKSSRTVWTLLMREVR